MSRRPIEAVNVAGTPRELRHRARGTRATLARGMSEELTRCAGTGCPLREDCLRARLEAVGRFDAFVRAPWDPVVGACEQHVALASTEPDPASIAVRAYHRWLREGRPEGRADAHWTAAREELIEQALRGLRPRESTP